MDNPVIEVRGLSKSFRGKPAVRDLSFSVARGEVLGLLGPNGAGKSTTIHLLLGLTTPDRGEVRVLGCDMRRDARRALARVNFSSAYVSMPDNLTVAENLTVFALLYGVRDRARRIAELLELLEITDLRKKVTGSLSTGQLTRLNLCKALLNEPEVLFLDEPTAGLDPDIAAKVRSILCAVQEERGVTMLYTSHNMAEVETLCHRILFLHRGRRVAEGTPEEVKRLAASESLEQVFITIARDGLPGAGS